MKECSFNAPNMAFMFQVLVESRTELLEDATERIVQLVRSLPCSPEDPDAVSLALSEALANAIIHGNKEDPRKKVQVCGGCENEGQLLLVITDEEKGLTPQLSRIRQ